MKKNIDLHHHSIHKHVDGPVQCGVGQPYLDGLCCSNEGEFGYKVAQCAPENRLLNCDAKALCGVDSADGKTAGGLKLCCFYYDGAVQNMSIATTSSLSSARRKSSHSGQTSGF